MKPELRILGRAELLLDGSPVRFRSAKVVELLAFLATQHERRATRSQAADALYPDSLRARENLRQTLLYLAQSAPGLVDPSSLCLSSLEIDLDQFRGGDIESYQGPFLPECDSEWAMVVRADLEEEFVNKLIAKGFEILVSDPTRSANLAKRAIQADPYLEQARRLRWHALNRMGERALAASERAEYARFIRDEVGIELGPVEVAMTQAEALSLTPAERLLRAVALVPEAYEQGSLVSASENLLAAISDVAPEHPYLAPAWLSLARIQFEIGDTEGSETSIQEARRLPLTTGQLEEASSVNARILARLSRFEESQAEGRVASESPIPEVRAEGFLLQSYISWVAAEYAAALEQADRAIVAALQSGDGRQRVRALRLKASCLFRMDQPQDAKQYLEEGIQIASRIGRPDLASALRGDLGRLLEWMGDPDAARPIFRDAVAGLERTDYRVQYAIAVTYLADLEHLSRNYEEARRLHAIGVTTRRMIGDHVGLATSYRGLGKALFEIGDSQSATDSLSTALWLFRRFGEAGSNASVRIPLARALTERGDLSEALRQATRAATELADLSDESILIRYNDESLLPRAVSELIAQLQARLRAK